jgi:hypothetical protein
MRIIKIFLALTIIFNLAAPIFVSAETGLLEQPKDINEALDVSGKLLENTQKEMPGLMERIWQNEVLPVWQKMFDWTKTHLWDNKLSSWLKNLWQNIKELFSSEVEQRTPTVKEEFSKEKQELKEEAPQVSKSLWEKFKELIK